MDLPSEFCLSLRLLTNDACSIEAYEILHKRVCEVCQDEHSGEVREKAPLLQGNGEGKAGSIHEG